MQDTEPAPIAIVAMSGMFPKAIGTSQFWDTIVNKIDATANTPRDRWIGPYDWVYNQRGQPDHAYSQYAALIQDYAFDSSGFAIESHSLDQMDPLYHWILEASRTAWHQTQVNDDQKPRVGVILAAIALPTEFSSSISRKLILDAQLPERFGRRTSGPLSKIEGLSGRIVGTPATVVSHALNLGGCAYTLDAACASSLYAVKLACGELRSYRADAMLAGGVSRPDPLYTQIGFSQLQALSPSGRCAPFDEAADGLVVGEGAGVLVLKRLEDAVSSKDTIYGVIRGIGLSNDMRGNLLAPESAGQLRCMRMAYEQAGWRPCDVDYIECHGAGTPVGDATELQSLRALWGGEKWEQGQCAIGSVKSNIGHLLTAAGAAGMIKTLLALHHKTLPPSLKFTSPKKDSPLHGSPFHVQTVAEPWELRDERTTRKAAVSAFGFGGINAHILIEEWPDSTPVDSRRLPIETADAIQETPMPCTGVAIVGMDLTAGPLDTVAGFRRALFTADSVLSAAPASRWKSPEAAAAALGRRTPVGAFVESIEVEVGEYTIPPGELPDILPQQLLMLKKAAGAMKDAGLPLRKTRDRMGTIIGIGFDYEATNFHLRWALPHIVSRLAAKGSGTIADEEMERWMIETKDQCGPPLTAARTLGALGGIVASRIAREFRFGGPSFAVSAEEASGLRAAEIGMHLLQSGELDAVLIGAVDLNCDERNLTTLKPLLQFSESGQVRPFDYHADGTLPGEGAVALVLKRLEDAQADGDRIYAVIKGMGTAGFSGATLTPAAKTYSISLERAFKAAGMTPDLIQLILAHGSGIPNQDRLEGDALSGVFHATHRAAEDAVAIGTTTPVIGHTGAASGLLSLAAAAICLRHRILPPVVNYESPLQEHWNRSCFHLPAKSAYWAHNRSEEPRGAVVAAITTDGNCMHAVLQEAKPEYRIGSDDGHSLKHPAGPLPYGLFLISGNDPHQLIENLKTLESSSQSAISLEATHIGRLAEAWQHRNSDRRRERLSLAVLARSAEDLHTRTAEARAAVENGLSCTMIDRGGVSYFGSTDACKGRLAFVYPGSGNHYVGMGRNLGLHWPEVLCAMEESTDHFRTQWLPQWYDPWRVDWRSGWRQQAYDALVSDPLNTIFGQVLFGGQMTGLLRSFNLSPDAVIGYSLGESAGFFAMGAWLDRGQMLDRLSSTNLFKDELCGSCTALRQAWQLPEDQEVTWSAAAVNRGAADVDQAVADWPYVRRLIVNTPGQCVIGGLKEQVAQAIKQMACEAVYLDGVVTVHCDAALPAEQAYRDLHRFDTTPLEGVDFYSCAFEKKIDLTSESAAESITRQAMGGFDFPATIEQAYADGIRVFVEVGPHSSCTRMIGDILGDRDHLAVAANQRGENELLTLLKCLGTLAAAGMKLDLAPLYLGTPVLEPDRRSAATIEVRVGNGPLYLTPPDFSAGSVAIEARRPPQSSSRQTHAGMSSPAAPGGAVERLDYDSIFKQMQETIDATARTHEKFLELSKDLTASYGKAFERQNDLIAAMAEAGIHIDASLPEGPDATYGADTEKAARAPSDAEPHQQTRIAFNREQCMEFAIGSVGKVLGPQFDIVDTFSARVRLPDEPLMLVDRILQVDGEKLSLGSGRVVTEHDVLPDMWYLDGNRAPVCISVEAGQADLFLSAYLGIDHRVRGERTYRLLDATIRFHRGLPRPGETIRYDIHIDKFVRQKETYLFFFHYEGHIGNEHLITMTRGCAGFFTEPEVRHSGGIILTDEDRAPGATVKGSPYAPLVPLFAGTFDDAQVDALRSGDAGACFGADFARIRLPGALRLPGGRMILINRIVELDPAGGKFAKGIVKAEADIHPDDWFLTCHFVDDMVMPGTLMYECCAHALRVLLLRMGWVTDKADVAYEPVPGIDCRLKCRGPVTPSTKRVHYAVEIKEMGYHPEPYVIADAHMHADGHYIVFFKDMSMQMSGVTQQEIEAFWQQRKNSRAAADEGARPQLAQPLFTRHHILEFAVGAPSKAFGEPYAVFDHDRRIARLPGPPYCFMDRIIAVEPEPWVLKPDGWVEAQYDVPEDAWYFTADRSGSMPFCVLLEIALQPCGWLAAYAGSALKSQKDLKFRNLGGKATVYATIEPQNSTLTMRARITKVSEAADMIIENFDFEVLAEGKAVYTGNTYFGFFTAQALAQQVGLRESVYKPSEAERLLANRIQFKDTEPITPEETPSGRPYQAGGLALPATALRMIDGIDIYAENGGPSGLGYIRGFKTVNPEEWFFKAHFYQDPVCPGSLGVESFLQLLKYAALKRWPHLAATHRFKTVCNAAHQWSYRGQVIPTNALVTVDAVITAIEEGPEPVITADGCLQVDGIDIYKMEGFGLRLVAL